MARRKISTESGFRAAEIPAADGSSSRIPVVALDDGDGGLAGSADNPLSVMSDDVVGLLKVVIQELRAIRAVLALALEVEE